MFSLMVVLMSMIASTPAGAKTDANSLKKMVPTNIVIKQTTQFNDGRTITLYYKKSGNICEVYSPDNVKAYNLDDATKIKSTHFEVVSNVEGTRYRKATVAVVAKIIKQMVNQFL